MVDSVAAADLQLRHSAGRQLARRVVGDEIWQRRVTWPRRTRARAAACDGRGDRVDSHSRAIAVSHPDRTWHFLDGHRDADCLVPHDPHWRGINGVLRTLD